MPVQALSFVLHGAVLMSTLCTCWCNQKWRHCKAHLIAPAGQAVLCYLQSEENSCLADVLPRVLSSQSPPHRIGRNMKRCSRSRCEGQDQYLMSDENHIGRLRCPAVFVGSAAAGRDS